jgi:hypothetical protein
MKLWTAGLALALALPLAGCGSSGGDNSNNSLVGTYRAAVIGKTGLPDVTCPGTLNQNNQELNSCGPNDTVTFNQNGTLSFNTSDGSGTGTYTVNGNRVTLNFSSGGLSGSAVADYSFSGSNNATLTFRDVENGTQTGEFTTYNRIGAQ